jgi:hypothetical protein
MGLSRVPEPSVASDSTALSFTNVLALLSGHAIVRSIAVVAELGIPDLLATGPKSAAELAARCDASEPELFRVLQGLASVGVFAQSAAPVKFGLTPLSHWLRSDVPQSLRDFARVRGGDLCWEAWTELEQSVRTGACAFEEAHGASFFAYLQAHPHQALAFNAAMKSLSTQVHGAVMRAYDFSRFRTLTDVGGGSGAFIAALLGRNPQLHGTLFDRRAAVEASSDVLRAAGVDARCERVAGDFFEAVPAGSESILLSRVLHDFSDADVVRILKNCHAALPRGGRLLIVEYVVTDTPDGAAAKLFDLHMLVYFGAARERSADELRELLAQAGFTMQRIVTTDASISVIEALA